MVMVAVGEDAMPAGFSNKFSRCCPRILQVFLQSCNRETAATSAPLDCAPGGDITTGGQWESLMPSAGAAVTLPSSSNRGIRTTTSFPNASMCSALPLVSYASCSPSPLIRGFATTDGVTTASNQVLSPVVMQRLRGMQVTGCPKHHFPAPPISDDIMYAIYTSFSHYQQTLPATYPLGIYGRFFTTTSIRKCIICFLFIRTVMTSSASPCPSRAFLPP